MTTIIQVLLLSALLSLILLPTAESLRWPFQKAKKFVGTAADIPGTPCSIEGMECICLPETPPISNPPMDLIELLQRGSNFLKNYTNVNNAVLFLGNTGAGKSTAAQIIAGNLSRLHAVVAFGDTMVIIDEDDRIGLPSLKSKTLFPELITKPAVDDDPALPFYDFPGFDDTRGPVEDIAANFFMTEVVRKVEKIKMLFVAVQSSVSGEIRDGFDSLAQHAVQFVKEIGTFTDSFGLLITKVRSYNNFGSYISDATILQGIVSFLRSYLAHLREDLEAGDPNEDELKKKIIFAEALLHQDSDGQYNRIWFIRSPVRCGRLSEHELFLDIKNNITALYKTLEFTPVGDVDQNFGFTLKDSTKLNIANYSSAINDEIIKAVTAETRMASQNYFKRMTSQVSDLETLAAQLRKDKQAFDLFLAAVDNMKVNPDPPSPEKLSFLMNSFLKEIGGTSKASFHDFMKWQGTYLDFFDKASEQQQRRDLSGWISPVLDFQSKFVKYVEWYDFCYRLQTYVFASRFQSEKPDLPPNLEATNWVEFVDTNTEFSVSPSIIEIAPLLEEEDRNVLKTLMIFALTPVQYNCMTFPQKAVVINGNFLHISTILPNLTNLAVQCGNAKDVLFLAGHTAFLPTTINPDGLSVSLLTPRLQSNEAVELQISLEGKHASPRSPPIAATGRHGSEFQAPGEGSNGYAGYPGEPGRNAFLLVGISLLNNSIVVKTNGGNGGIGQHGGTGGTGYSPRDSICLEQGQSSCVNQFYDNPLHCEYVSQVNNVYCYHYGFSAGNGATGGNGGKGALGAQPGQNTVFEIFSSNSFVQESKVGATGPPGNAGVGGLGGKAGKGYVNNASDYCQSVAASNGRTDGVRGRDGVSGTSELDLRAPQQPQHQFPHWASVLEYRKVFYNEGNPETTKFLNSVDTSSQTFEIFTLKGLAEESFALHNISRKNENHQRLADMYASLVDRLQRFHHQKFNDLSNEHKKVLSMLLANSAASQQALQPHYGLNTEIDISGNLDAAIHQIRLLSETSDRNAMHVKIMEKKQKQINTITGKFSEAVEFSNDIITPALQAVNEEIKAIVLEMEKELDDLINDDSITFEDALVKLRTSEQEHQKHKLLQIFLVITGMAQKILPHEDHFNGIVLKLTEKYSGDPIKSTKLNVFVEELENMNLELIKKQERFENTYVPFVNELLEYFQQVFQNITSDLEITHWLVDPEVVQMLRDCKKTLVQFSDEPLNNGGIIIIAFERLQNAITVGIDLYQAINQYRNTQDLSKYYGHMQSSTLKPITITDPDLKHTIQDFDSEVKESLLDHEVVKAWHAFRQWVFPFATFYTPTTTSAAAGDRQAFEIEYLQSELNRYKSMIVGNLGQCIFQTSFSSDLITGKPFYSWINEDFSSQIEHLLSGNATHLYADVTLQTHSKWESIKFKLLEINFKLNGAPEGYEEEFRELLDYFGVSLTHSGISYYRFIDQYYVMRSSSQTIMYHFEKDGSGNRLGTNMVYQNFKNGNYLLSPFTMWTIQLRLVVPERKGKALRTNVSFDDFQKFRPYIDVELVGVGTYVDGDKALEGANGNMALDTYYEKEERLELAL